MQMKIIEQFTYFFLGLDLENHFPFIKQPLKSRFRDVVQRNAVERKNQQNSQHTEMSFHSELSYMLHTFDVYLYEFLNDF